MALPIPIIKTRGTPYQVGHQIGIAAGDALREMYAGTLADYGDRWTPLVAMSRPFLEITAKRLPKVMAEMRGCADGARISFDDLFLMSVEELLYEEVRGADRLSHFAGFTSNCEGSERDERSKGCSDLAAAPPATRDGHVWLAHNNDLGKSALNHLFVTHFCVDGEPEILAVTMGGLFISIGLSNAGISLTGNQLNANDSRVGLPRLLLVRDMLAQRTLEDALASALMPERASSYNNILASRDGRIVNAEGSATTAALSWSGEHGGTLAHTNHYLDETMLSFEADTRHVAMSASRCARAFDYAKKYRGTVDFEVCARFVRDHVYEPWSVCKHAGSSVTVFSALIDLSEQKMWLTRGNPCENDFSIYTFCAQ